MLGELGMKPHCFTLKLDDQPPIFKSGVALVVANAGEIGGGLKFAPTAKMDDGVLDVCILRRFYLRDVLRLIWRSFLGTVPADRAGEFLQAKRVEIETNPPLDLQIDGEEVEITPPLVAEAVPHALLVRVPLKTSGSAAFLQSAAQTASQAVSPLRILARLLIFAALLAAGFYILGHKRNAK